MKKRTWTVASMFAVAAIAGVSLVSLYGIQDVQATKEKVKIKNEEKMMDHRPKEIREKIEKSWSNALKAYAIDDSEWTKIDYADSIHLTETLSQEEKTSFIDSMYGAMEKYSKIGDMMPLMLVNEDKSKVVILFQHDEGKGKTVKIELALKGEANSLTNDGASRKWTVENVEEK